MSEGVYEGRLMTDGNGNLLADESVNIGEQKVFVYDENGNPVTDGAGNVLSITIPVTKYGENHGKPVKAHEGSYVFISLGEPSHNQTHEQNRLEMVATQDQDPEAPGFAGTPDSPEEGAEHHWDAPDPDNEVFDADIIASKITGHTSAYVGGSE